jgi:crotonobetainyl-CoA:carnitine CoA-transferase CaiB-like acyl-CoA transferase
MSALPLQGLRVLDIATFIAAPFCGTILGDFGAEVIKVEQPGTGDPLRRFGTATEAGDTLVWLSEARNKRSITLDLRKPEGADIFRRLAGDADIVLENFRPGTLERWNLGWDQLSALNPRLIMLRISAYGQTGPYKDRPGFARIAHAFSGLAYLAGEPGRIPVMPGSTSLADYTSGLWGAIGILLAVRARDTSGRGQFIDIGLYESVFRLLDEIAPAYAKTGFIRERLGADTVNVVPHSHYETADGRYVAIACTNDKMFIRLAAAMARDDLASEQSFGTMAKRLARREEVNGFVADWVRSKPADRIAQICEDHEVPCGILLSIEDIFSDPHFASRQNMQAVRDGRAGAIVVPTAMPRMSDVTARLDSLGPALGESNAAIYGTELGMSDVVIAELKAKGVV